jgi:hypothetical protein
VSSTTLIRWGGGAAVIGGVLRALASFAPMISIADTALQLLWLIVDVFLLFGVLAFYALHHERIGRSGAIGFLIAVVALALIRSARAIAAIDVYPIGAFAFVVGVLLMCVRARQAKRLQGWIPATLIVSIFLGIAGTVLPAAWLFILSGVLFGAGFVGLGLSVRTSAL